MSTTNSILLQILGIAEYTRSQVELTAQIVAVQQKKLDAILTAVQKTPEMLHGIALKEEAINDALRAIAEGFDDKERRVIELLRTLVTELQPTPAVTFTGTTSVPAIELLTRTKENTTMAKALKVGADLSVQDDGSVNIAFDAVDAAGVKTAWPTGVAAPTLAEVDPSGAPGPSFDVPNATTTPTATGFVVNTKVIQPPPQPLQTGITFTGTVPSGFPNQTAPLVVTADPAVDVVAGPANSFVASESNA